MAHLPRRLALALMVPASLLFAAAPAHAASSAAVLGGGTSSVSLSINSNTNEPNTITVSHTTGTTYRVTDTAGVTNGGGCTMIDSKTYDCNLGPITVSLTTLQSNLGPGDDRFTATSAINDFGSVVINGEGGKDTVDVSQVALRTGLFFFTSTTLNGGSEDDTLTGSATVNNQFTGGPGVDVMTGGSASDTFSPDATADGADTMTGGAGLDGVSYAVRTAAVDLSADGNANDGEPGEGDNVGADIEQMIGGPGNDKLAAGASPSTLVGSSGNDQLIGGPADDVLLGNAGLDSLDGGGGDDAVNGNGEADDIHGGPGFDSTGYADQSARVEVSLNDAPGDGLAGEGDNVHSDVEQVTGGSAGDLLVGGPGAERLVGGPGDDTIDGGGGSDFLRGAAGADTILGRDGAVDDIGCGTEVDSATADFADTVQPDCETTDRSPAPDVAGPKLTLSGLKKSMKLKDFLKGVAFSVTPDESSAFSAELLGAASSASLGRLVAPKASFNLTLATKTLKLGSGKRKITLKPNRKLVGGRKGFSVRMHLLATDAAGNPTETTRTIKVSP
jgi:Ca2+-binding RTX toxin-like protein